jgi:hypothetical protein
VVLERRHKIRAPRGFSHHIPKIRDAELLKNSRLGPRILPMDSVGAALNRTGAKPRIFLKPFAIDVPYATL